ncbi:MAG: WD40/YVTN/BNR-like repeat-containing protein, partial [Terriglobales bacterium]
LTVEKGKPAIPCGTPVPPAARGGRGAVAGGGGRGPAPASITDFSLSTFQKGVVWSVSSNGQIYNTTDGGLHWSNVSNVSDAPAGVTYNTIEAGSQDAKTAYLSGRLGGGRGGAFSADGGNADTNVPLIWRTHDGGKTCTKIVSGLPSDEVTGSWVNVVRADPKQKGLLFAGTETTVYTSFDDGDHWQSLRQNLPSTSIRDIAFHTDDHMNDLVLGTYGRGFWVMDDISPLREVAAKAAAIAAAPAYFFKPGDAIRARFNANWDQPSSIELPHAPNPPYGAILYYHLSQPASSEITLKIYDARGTLVRTMSSVPPPPTEGAAYPDYWLATPASRALPTAAGTNRTHWDLQYDDPPSFNHDLENQMNMVQGTASAGPHGPQVLPGVYTLKLTVDGQTYTQTVRVRNDPRVGESAAVMAALRAQNRLTMLAYQGMKDSYAGNEEVAAARAQLANLSHGELPAEVAAQAKALDTKLGTFGGAPA